MALPLPALRPAVAPDLEAADPRGLVLPTEMMHLVIAESNGRGGKAGRGHNRTATIQVRQMLTGGDYLLKKQFRYKVGDRASRESAVAKARGFADKTISDAAQTVSREARAAASPERRNAATVI